jgi:hypothetical protein
MTVFISWRDLMSGVNKLTEEELRQSINLEASTYRRAPFIKRMHQRYERLRSPRERAALIAGELLL